MTFLRRHPTTSTILGAVVLLALAVLGASVWAARDEPAPATTTTTVETSTPSSTTTTEAPTTTTAPATTVTPPPAPRPTSATTAPRPATTAPATSAPATTTPEITEPAEPCARALVGVRAVGLPAGWAFYCSAERTQGHAGIAYWSSAGGSYIAVSPRTGNFEGVGAHEACHAQEFTALGTTTEATADACAAAHGWPNPYAGTDDVVTAPDTTLRWLETALLAAALVLVLAVLTLLPLVRRRLARKDP